MQQTRNIKKTILGIGQVLWDIVIVDETGKFAPYMKRGDHIVIDLEEFNHLEVLAGDQKQLSPGGSVANVMSMLGKLGHKPTFLGKAGTDFSAKEYKRLLEADDVQVVVLNDPIEKTGQLYCIIASDRERSFIVYRGANRTLHPDELDGSFIQSFDFIHTSGYLLSADHNVSILEKIMPYAQNYSIDLGTVSIVSRYKRELESLFERYPPKILFMNHFEAQEFTSLNACPEIFENLDNLAETIVITQGVEGVWICHEGSNYHHPSISVPVTDLTGAGDAFCAGFLSEYLLQGHSVYQACQKGAELASKVIQDFGARSYQPE
ncbi:MAG: carbohydrate kinase family protein [Promethearchaeota archaeon]